MMTSVDVCRLWPFLLICILFWLPLTITAQNGKRKSCADDSFLCVDGSCIPDEWVCDGPIDCSDGSDETNCTTITAKYPAPEGILVGTNRPKIQPIDSFCPPPIVLHKICAKSLNPELYNSTETNELNRGPLSLRKLFTGCLSFASYSGCLVALSPDPKCWPKQQLSLWLNTTSRLFCSPEVLSNISIHSGCLQKVKKQESVLGCQRKFLLGPNFSENSLDACPILASFYEFSRCIQTTVSNVCDNVASRFLSDLRQNIVIELDNFLCKEAIGLKFITDTSTLASPKRHKQLPDAKLNKVIREVPQKVIEEEKDVAAAEKLPFTEIRESETRRLREEEGRIGEKVYTSDVLHTEKRLYLPCSNEQEKAGRECFKWVSALPHAGRNYPPNQWMTLMAETDNRLMSDTCTTLRVYDRCLEQTAFRNGTQCSFHSWIPTHIRIALGVLCDPQVTKELRQNEKCLISANRSRQMDECSRMDVELVRLIKQIYSRPRVDTTCQVVESLRNIYECIDKVLFDHCGRSFLSGMGRIAVNIATIAIEEGCPICL